MNISQRIFFDHFYSLKKLDIKIIPAVFNNVYRMLRCGDIRYGYTLYGCETCGKFHAVAFTCKSRFCNCCGVKYAKQPATNMSCKLVNANHRHCVFTITEELRNYLGADRSLLNCLFDVVNDTIKYIYLMLFSKVFSRLRKKLVTIMRTSFILV